jgi:heptosyltransferase-1
MRPVPTPKSILIVRLSAIGDVILASGLIPALRAAFPEARLGWLAEESQADLLRHNPRLDRLHLWPRRRWRELRRARRYRQLAREALALVRALREERYDLVLDLQGLLKSGAWAFLSGGRRRIGLGSREGSRLLMTEVLDRRVDDGRIGKEYRKLALALGAPEEAYTLDIAVSDEDHRHALEFLPKVGVTGPFSVIAPFTTRPQKHWLDENWAELALRLGDRLPVLMLGGPGDRERAGRIQTLAGEKLIDLTGRTTLGQCAALIERAELLVGVDTGLTHLATALGIPTLALFGSTRPYLDTGRPSARVLYEKLECSPCRRRPTCGGSFDCMRRHGVEAVHAAALELLEHSP